MPVGFLSRTPLDWYRFDGSYAWALGSVVLTLLCSILFAIGFRTRFMTVALWVLMTALLRRNQLATDGGDSVARCLLFWSMFLPLGAFWSVDVSGRADVAVERLVTRDGRAVAPTGAALLHGGDGQGHAALARRATP